MRKIDKIVVHCSATSTQMDIGVAEIERWHRQRGFTPTADSPAIGYHAVIRRDGTVELGRPEHRAGAHAQGHNANSLAVCLVGGVKVDGKTPVQNFTEAQYESLESVLVGWLLKYGQVPVVGHRDLPGVAKACPSFEVKDWWAARSKVREATNG